MFGRMLLVCALVIGAAVLEDPATSRADVLWVPLDLTFAAGSGHPGLIEIDSGEIAVAADDGIITMASGPAGFTRVKPDGTVDTAFGDPRSPGTITFPTVGPLRGPMIDPRGRIVARDDNAGRIWRASATGIADSMAFTDKLAAVDGIVGFATYGFDRSGRFIVAARLANHTSLISVRLLDDGTVDTSYAAASTEPGLVDAEGAFAVDPRGGVLLQVAPNARIERLTPDGVYDSSYNGGVGFADLGPPGGQLEIHKVSFDDADSAIISGVTIPACGRCVWLTRVSVDGVVDRDFARNATDAASVFEAVTGTATLAGGHIVVYGQTSAGHSAVLMLDSHGRPDSTYGWTGGSVGAVQAPSGPAMAVDHRGRVLLGGVADISPRQPALGRLGAFGTRFTPIAPMREVDTRIQRGGHRMTAGETERFMLPDLPADAAAATFNLTAADTGAPGFLMAYPCANERPKTSSVNFARGQVAVPNQVTVAIADRQVCVFAYGEADVIIDLSGYFSTRQGAGFVASSGRRWDTRTSGGFDPSGRVLSLDFSDAPADAVAVSLNITADEVSGPGWVGAAPCGSTPSISNLNPTPGSITAGHVTVTLGPDRHVCLTTYARLALVVDLTGWWTTAGPGVFSPVGPDRLVDTREGLGGYAIDAGETRQITPARPGTAFVNVTSTESLNGGWIAVFPCSTPFRGTSTVNFGRGQNVANAALVDSSSGICATSYSRGQIIVDIFATMA